MRIIISPAKKMAADDTTMPWADLPQFLPQTEQLLEKLRSMSLDECQKLWACNQNLAELNYDRVRHMDLRRNLSPAILSYVGIQYQYMAANVLDENAYAYLQEHLRILSGFYGALRPFDGVTPYRLEMQSKLAVGAYANLYEFWGDALYHAALDDSRTIINLASKEYSKCVETHLQPEDTLIDVVFGELVNGKVVQKGTFAKMARGEMVRFLADSNAADPEAMKEFAALDYAYAPDLSTERKYIFLRIAH